MWLIFFFSFQVAGYFDFEIPYSNFWKGAMIISLCSITVLISGIGFTNSVKLLVSEALENKFLNSLDSNKVFLKRAHPWIAKISIMEENLYNMYGVLTAIACIQVFHGFININSASLLQYFLYFIYSSIVLYLAVTILKIVWNNRYLIKLIRRIPNDTYKFNLYELRRTAGVEILIRFFRSLSLYNLAVIILLNLSYTNLKTAGIEIHFVFVLMLSIFFSWNYSSFYIIAFKFRKVKKNFEKQKSTEMEKLSRLNSAASITRYDFLKNLKLKFWPVKKLSMAISNVFLYLIPIIASYLIPKYQNELDFLFAEILDLINKVG